MAKLVYAPGTRVRSRDRSWNPNYVHVPRYGTIIGRVGTSLAVQWDGETRAMPYNNWHWHTPANSPLKTYRGEPRTWRICSPVHFELV